MIRVNVCTRIQTTPGRSRARSAASHYPAPAGRGADRDVYRRLRRLGQRLLEQSSGSSSSSSSDSDLSATALLGKQLFSDTSLSVPLGGPNMDLPGFRNAPSLRYASFAPPFSIAADNTPTGGFFRDGRASSLAESTTMTVQSKLLTACVSLLFSGVLYAATDAPAPPSVDERITQLQQQLQAIEQEIQQLKARTASVPAPAAPAAPVPATTPVAPAPTEAAANPLEYISLWGYGEIYYARPIHMPQATQADLARAVFGIGYTFDPRTQFNSEFEVEHAVSSADDVGEFEVEQFYVDRQLADEVKLRAGLFLMPFGLLNEHHEPTNFYGMQRNFVETLIIPSTWREGGVGLQGESSTGLSWNVGLTTGFDLSKWNYVPEFPTYTTALELEDNDVAPLQSTHQELALANAEHVSGYAALNYNGVPGLQVGAAISSGDATKVPAPPNAPIFGNQRVTLWELHTRWTPWNFDLSALYAHGSISNLTLANASTPGSPNPIPSAFYGYFFQAAWNVWESNEYRLAPFARWETYSMGSSYEGSAGPVVPMGIVPVSTTSGDYGTWPQNHDRVWTFGANFYVTPHVVFKADYQNFDINTDFTRVDLGLGLNY